MVKRIGGSRKRTRRKLKKDIRSRGKLSLTKFFQKFKTGDRVVLKMEPGFQKGGYFPRFHGKLGVIKAKRGRCYEVLIKDIRKEKTLIVHPVHLKEVK